MTSAAVAAAVAAVVGQQQTTTASTMSEDGQQSLESLKQEGSEGVMHSSPKSNSAPQSITQNTFPLGRFDSMEMSPLARSPPPADMDSTKSGGSGSSTLTASHRPLKPHIRINDYFALPSYLQHHFGGAHRPSSRQTAVNFLMRGGHHKHGGSEKHGSGSSGSGRVGSPSKSTLAVLQFGNRGGGNAGGGRGTSSGHGSSNNADPKQVSSESLAPIPNKGIYKVFWLHALYWVGFIIALI